MINYNSISPTTGKPTGIIGYDYSETQMIVYFTSGSVYAYTLESCGQNHLSTMKSLADSQNGLNTYLTKNKPQYAYKKP